MLKSEICERIALMKEEKRARINTQAAEGAEARRIQRELRKAVLQAYREAQVDIAARLGVSVATVREVLRVPTYRKTY